MKRTAAEFVLALSAGVVATIASDVLLDASLWVRVVVGVVVTIGGFVTTVMLRGRDTTNDVSLTEVGNRNRSQRGRVDVTDVDVGAPHAGKVRIGNDLDGEQGVRVDRVRVGEAGAGE